MPKNIMVTASEKDTHVIAAFEIAKVVDVALNGETTSFDVIDKDGNLYNFAAEEQEDADDWICKMKTMIGEKCTKTEAVPVVEEEKLIKPVIIIPQPSPNCEIDWNYNQHGKDWLCRCKTGRQQSPIDIDR